MKTHFILLKITTDGDVPDLTDKAAGRIYTASGVRDCVVITPALSLPTCAVDVSGEELWSRDQVLTIQNDAYAEGRREEAEASDLAVQSVSTLFESCASTLVPPDYANGYREAIEHCIRALKSINSAKGQQ